MPAYRIHEWNDTPLESLVIGDGCFAVVFATCFGAGLLSEKELRDGPESSLDGAFCVPKNLERIMLVVSDNMVPAEAIQCHAAIWHQIEQSSRAKDQHDLAFVFVLPPSAGTSYEEALAAGLGLPTLDPATTGHAVWNRSGSLSELLKVIDSIQPHDLMWLQACRTADGKRKALAQLRGLPANAQPTAIQAVAKLVLDEFRDKQYLLDVYCRPPSHQNGNELRKWLRAAVTGPVTQDWWEGTRRNLDQWLNVKGL